MVEVDPVKQIRNFKELKQIDAYKNWHKKNGIKNIIYSDIDNGVTVSKISDLECNHITRGNQRVYC